MSEPSKKPYVSPAAQSIGHCRCGGSLSAPVNPEKDAFLLHSLPYCKEFEKLDLPEFLVWVRTGVGKS